MNRRPWPLILLLTLLPTLGTGCDDEVAEEEGVEIELSEDRPGAENAPARESGFAMSAAEGADEMIDLGERFAATLGEIRTTEDIEEHRAELVGFFSAMQELEAALSEKQATVEAILDTNARALAVNDQLRSELMRIAADSALGARLANIRAEVTGVPLPQ